MSVHFTDAKEVLNILRDIQTYIFVQHKNDELGKIIVKRINKVLIDNDKEAK